MNRSGSYGLDVVVFPVALERRAKGLQHSAVSAVERRTFHSRPSTRAVFERFDEPIERRRKARRSLEEPRLGMQTGRRRVVGDLDLGADVDEGLECARF